MTSMHLIAATTVQTSVGYILLFLVAVAVVVYGLANFRSGKSEVGSEVVLAPNRKPYYNDQDMETKRLDRMLTMAFVTLAAISVILPLYWLNEPSGQARHGARLRPQVRRLGQGHVRQQRPRGEPRGPRLRALPRRQRRGRHRP